MGVLMYRYIFIVLWLGLVACADSSSGTEETVKVEVVVSGLDHPWSLAFLDRDNWLVTERSGSLRWIQAGVLQDKPVKGTPKVAVGGQGGLLDIALHPAFNQTRWVYLSYAKARADGMRTTAVGRGRWNKGALEEFTDIYIADAWSDSGHHFGGRLLFDREGYLYLSIGDRGDRGRAQNPHDNAGNILRLRDDGGIPEDNPFADNQQGHPAVWTYGNRNPQGLALHPDTGAIWQHEHGPRGGDEINLLRPGVNYGWPVITYGREYYGPRIGTESKPGLEQPLKYWTPSIAPSGMAFYSGDVFPQWRGDIFVGALAHEHLTRVRFRGLDEVEEEKLLVDYARIRDVRVGKDGFIYVLTDEDNGQLLRLRPKE